jgi:thymidylate synthase
LTQLIDGLRRDPFGRRHILSAWNPGELSEMALPPCHVMAQFYVSQGLLSCMLTQRSNDLFLGSPYNIASYALLTHMIAQVCGYKPGELVYSQGDVHIYHDHFDAVKEQLGRTPKPSPHLYIDPTVKEIDQFTMDSFDIMGYDPHPAIRAKMAV